MREVHKIFQSTLPAGEATRADQYRPLPHRGNFNPRFPRGKRQLKDMEKALQYIFQSTLPAGEATQSPRTPCEHPGDFNPRFPQGKRHRLLNCKNYFLTFQSTLPAGEATPTIFLSASMARYFNPRFPRGKRQVHHGKVRWEAIISIHASRGGSDPTVSSSLRGG